MPWSSARYQRPRPARCGSSPCASRSGRVATAGSTERPAWADGNKPGDPRRWWAQRSAVPSPSGNIGIAPAVTVRDPRLTLLPTDITGYARRSTRNPMRPRTMTPPRRAAGIRAKREVALEATTGWRFVVEELHAIGPAAHLAEPAETAARRGNKKRAKTDRADARHLRELLMIGRLPESWIPPEHLLELRAKVRLRHTLVDQRGEWQQRIQAALYHHGCPQRRNLMTAHGRQWLAAEGVPRTAREQITVASR